MKSLESPLYHGPCEYCEGTVVEKIVPREIFPYLEGFVILEHVPIGVCNQCQAKYYHCTVMHRVAEVAARPPEQQQTVNVPVGVFVSADFSAPVGVG